MFRRKTKPEFPPEWLIVGLGNPGGEYRGTRHNVGFDVIDRLAAKHRVKVNKGVHRAIVGIGQVGGTWVALAKPLTFMNLSGQAVAAIAKQHGLKPDHVLVVADDMDLVLGRVRLKPKGSAGGHNGHKSIIQCLGSEEYPRLKVGIGQPSGNGIDHVLSGFTPDERMTVDEAIRQAVAGCEAVAAYGVERAMSMVNLPRDEAE